jgi:hypothetical protein
MFSFNHGGKTFAVVAAVSVLVPGVAQAAPATTNSYNIDVDNSGNVKVVEAGGPIVFPTVNHPSYKVTDLTFSRVLKLMAPSSVSINGRVVGNTLKINYVNGSVLDGTKLRATPDGKEKATISQLADAHIVDIWWGGGGSPKWFKVKTKAGTGWVSDQEISYHIYFALHAPVAPDENNNDANNNDPNKKNDNNDNKADIPFGVPVNDGHGGIMIADPVLNRAPAANAPKTVVERVEDAVSSVTSPIANTVRALESTVSGWFSHDKGAAPAAAKADDSKGTYTAEDGKTEEIPATLRSRGADAPADATTIGLRGALEERLSDKAHPEGASER